jgi:hypothetical protein
MISYNQKIIQKLKEIPHVLQGAVGVAPADWAKRMDIQHSFSLPNQSMTRQEVRLICQDLNQDILKAYLIAMAWGGQGLGPGGKRHAQAAWRDQPFLISKIEAIRKGGLSRAQSYDLFIGDSKVDGLGPAYFTKLLYFFSPANDCYIMDQWTTKPIILLTGMNLIRHTNQGPSQSNKGLNYELFCRIIEDLAKKMEVNSGDEMEQRLFSNGSVGKSPRGEFRQFVIDEWESRPNIPRYNLNYVQDLLEKGIINN